MNRPVETIDKETQRLIDELAQKHPFSRPWTVEEDTLLRATFGRIKTNIIHEKFFPHRTARGVEYRIQALGLRRKSK